MASSSRGGTGPSPDRAAASAGNGRRTSERVPEPPLPVPRPRAEENRGTTKTPPIVLAIREGEALPAGYTYVVRESPRITTASNATKTVDLSTPPEPAPPIVSVDDGTTKRRVVAKRNATRSTNKQAHATYTKEVKESLAGGRPPSINGSDAQTHLKASWHARAKELAYKMLDLRKEGWKEYNTFEKGQLYRELCEQIKFNPPWIPDVWRSTCLGTSEARGQFGRRTG